MLDNLNEVIARRKQDKYAKEAEGRERDFIRERDAFQSGNDPRDQFQIEANRSDLLKWQQDLADEMQNLQRRLLSQELTEKGWEPKIFYRPGRDGKLVAFKIPPLANELFIDYIQTQCEPFVSRNLLNSNFDEARILQILKNTCDDIAGAMALGFDYYEIDFENFDLIMRLIKNTIIPGPFRALNDGERRHARTISKRIESFNEGRDPIKKKSLFGFA